MSLLVSTQGKPTASGLSLVHPLRLQRYNGDYNSALVSLYGPVQNEIPKEASGNAEYLTVNTSSLLYGPNCHERVG